MQGNHIGSVCHHTYSLLFSLLKWWSKLPLTSFQFPSEPNINKPLWYEKNNYETKVSKLETTNFTHTKESRCPPTFKLMKTIKMWIEQGRFLSSFFSFSHILITWTFISAFRIGNVASLRWNGKICSLKTFSFIKGMLHLCM